MAYKVIILYRLYMPSYVLGTFTEYPKSKRLLQKIKQPFVFNVSFFYKGLVNFFVSFVSTHFANSIFQHNILLE